MTHIAVDVTDYAERFYSDIKNEALFMPIYKEKKISIKEYIAIPCTNIEI